MNKDNIRNLECQNRDRVLEEQFFAAYENMLRIAVLVGRGYAKQSVYANANAAVVIRQRALVDHGYTPADVIKLAIEARLEAQHENA